jgi:hypothetical protein
MSTYTELAPYLQKEYPKFTESEGSIGNTYLYRYPNAGGTLLKPQVGQTWEDGRPITAVDQTPSLDNSGYNELTVSTVYQASGHGELTETTLESVRYQIRWNPQQLPLIRHPVFQKGASKDLFTGDDFGSPLQDVAGWEMEQDPSLKYAFKYKKLDSNGVASNTVVTITSAFNVYYYILLRILGFDSYTEFTPVWQKVSIYRGQNAPGVGSIGQYVAGSDVPELPDNLSSYDYIKSADAAERIGVLARWQRTEEWTGFTRVYFDTDSFNPANYDLS